MDDRDWRERIREGREFDRATLDSWSRVFEGSEMVTDQGVGPGLQAVGRPDIRFVVDEGEDGAAVDAVLEVKDRDWDHMLPANAKRAVRRDGRQISRYIEAVAALRRATGKGAEIVASLIYRRSPSDAGLRQWAEDYLGGIGVAVLWESGDAATSEWFAEMVRVALQSLGPWADRTGLAFGIWCGRQGMPPEAVIGPRPGPARADGAALDSARPSLELGQSVSRTERDEVGATPVVLGLRPHDGQLVSLAVVAAPEGTAWRDARKTAAIAHAAAVDLAAALRRDGLIAADWAAEFR